MIYFTKHAIQRMEEHGISYGLAMNAIANGKRVKQNKEIVINWQRLIIIMDNHNRVITINYNTSKIESE